MNYIKLLPSNWSEVTWKDYLKIESLKEDDEVASNIETLFYVFTSKNINVLKPVEFEAVMRRLSFMYQLPTKNESKLSFKTIRKLNFQEYINYQKLIESPDDLLDNLIHIVKIFAPDADEDSLTVIDVMGCFFLQQKKMKPRLIFSMASLTLKILKGKVETFLKKKLKLLKRNTTRNLHG
ncbi:hypothetical protein OQZ33_07035 [Pedobacter sp. MC2016-05]|uniref:hypothetical protein n=1 Tax=Pedobacter sp. MC2016-05 TaxID=2994474 RepID=UPI00224758AA|nr:hypothetical protein [Pedobacter sp. MC2016-05]MCX2474079.1 hypothetical protein [Pedobacter sp. MC2016-05]